MEELALTKEFKGLLDDFLKLPEVKTRRTIFSVAEYSHYENVASNILAFYFDTNEEHNLSDLLVSSLLACFNNASNASNGADVVKYEGPFKTNEVHREDNTNGGGRIDLVIDMPEMCICIENKIYAGLYNPLEDYQETIEKKISDDNESKKAVFIVLSINEIGLTEYLKETKNITGIELWKNITYLELWCEVRERIGQYIALADGKWLDYLLDFMTETERLGGKGIDLTDQDNFFIENFDNVQKLIDAREDFTRGLAKKQGNLIPKTRNFDNVQKLINARKGFTRRLAKEQGNLIVTGLSLQESFEKTNIHDNKAFEICFNLSGHKVTFNLQIQCDSKFNRVKLESAMFILSIYKSGFTPEEYLDEIYKNIGVQWTKHNNRSYVVRSWSLDENLETIAKDTIEVIKQVLDADKEIQASKPKEGEGGA